MLEDDRPEQNLPDKILCRVWTGTRNPLSQTILPEGYHVVTTIGGRKFAVLNFANGSNTCYNLNKTPVSVDYFPRLTPEQGNLRAAWISAKIIKSCFLIPHEIAYRDNMDNQLCRNVFSTSRKYPFLNKIKSIARRLIKPFKS